VETPADPSTSPGRYPRLRPGPGLSREIVAAHQQSRLQQALIELVAARGYEAVTVRGLAKRARISTGTFYRHYSSSDDCLLSTFDLICARASQRLLEVGRDGVEPRRRLAFAVDRLFQDVVAAPQVATFMLRAAPTVGPGFSGELWSSAMQLGAALELCMRSDDSPRLHPFLLEGVVAGLARLGSLLTPAAGDDEIGAVTAEAVEWIEGLCALPVLDAEAPGAIAPRVSSNGGSVRRRSRSDEWEGVLGDEREMMLAAAFRIARGGYHQLSVTRICREAGVSRRDFKRHFEDVDDCFVAALEERAGRTIEAWMRRRSASATWSRAVREALDALCDAIEADRGWASVLFVEITAAGTKGIDSRDRLISQVARSLRTTAPESQAPSELAAEASTAAAWAILRRLALDESLAATEALPVLTLLMLSPAEDRKHTVGDEKRIS
jgi:AcrR family transcriptional regulator